MSLGHFLDVYNGLARCSPVLHYIGKAGFFIFVMLGQSQRHTLGDSWFWVYLVWGSLLSPVTHSSVPFSCPCLTSFVPSLTSLYFVSSPLSYVSVPCLPSSVPCLMALLLVSRPLYPVYQLSQCPFFVALFHLSCPLLLCFPSSVPPSLVFCPLFFILARMRDFLKNTP